jgi:hypothetical protein
MSANGFKLKLGLAVLVFFSINGPWIGSAFIHGTAESHFPPNIANLAAPVLQDTSYPPAPTQGDTQGYPQPPTATTGSGYPGPETATPGLVSTSTPVPNQTTAAATPTLGTGTLAVPSKTALASPTTANDIFLTENSEMGQSRATPLPTETPSPSATLTTSPTLIQPTATLPPDQSFKMDWGVFLGAFFAMIVVGGAAWFTFLKRILFPKA